MIRVTSMLKPYRVAIAVALLFMLFELSVELLQPLWMAKIIDEGVAKRDFHAILLWGSLMLGMSLAAFIGGLVSSFYASYTSQSFGYDIRTAVFRKLQTFSFSNLQSFPTASLITRMTNDVTQMERIVFMCLRIALRAPLLIIGSVLIVLTINWRLGLFLVVSLPLLVLFLQWSLRRGRTFFKFLQMKLDTVNSVMRENLFALRLIKALRRQGYERNRFTQASEDLKQQTISVLQFMESIMPLLLLVMNLLLVAILWFGNVQMGEGHMKAGELVSIVNYTFRITSILSVLSFITMALSRARASAIRLEEVLNTTVLMVDGDDGRFGEGKVVFEEVSFAYPGTEKNVLQHISFVAQPGETVAILGATGSGKSSLFQLIPRFYDTNEGTVWIDGKQVQDLKMDVLRRQIGYVPQEALLFTGTIRENIAFGKKEASMKEIIEAAKHAQIHETIMNLPQQYETLLGQKGVNLSGGQKQRLSIARALVRHPKILLLDDSTSALDLKTEAKLLEALHTYACTTFIITQKISTAMTAQQILLLEDGTLLAKGTHEELLRQSGLYKRIYESQFGEEEAHA